MMTSDMRIFIILLMSSIAAEGTITLSCTPLIPEEGTSSTCTCINSVANGIQWVKDSTGLVSCPSPGVCLGLSGYNLSSTGTEYSLEIMSYTYTSCGIYTCRDNADNNVNDSVTIDMYDFTNTSPTGFQSPPANHSDGNIEIETECLFYKDEDDIKIEWYTVEGSKIETYDPQDGTYSNETQCLKTCNSKPAKKKKIGFKHEEEADQSNARNVRFKLVVYHKENPAKTLELTTDNEYSIKKATTPSPEPCGCPWWCILIICCLLYLCGIVIGIFMYCCKDEPWDKIYVEDKTYWWIFLLIIVIAGLGILTVYLICKGCGRFNAKNESEPDPMQEKMKMAEDLASHDQVKNGL